MTEELKQEAEENSKIVYGYINDAYVVMLPSGYKVVKL